MTPRDACELSATMRALAFEAGSLRRLGTEVLLKTIRADLDAGIGVHGTELRLLRREAPTSPLCREALRAIEGAPVEATSSRRGAQL